MRELVGARVRQIVHELHLIAACEAEGSLKCQGRMGLEFAKML